MAIELTSQKINRSSEPIPNYTLIPIEGVVFPNNEGVFVHIITPTGPTFEQKFNTSLTWNNYSGEVWEEGTTLTIDTPLKLDGDLEVENKQVILREHKIKFIGPFEGKIFENKNGKIEIQSNQTDTQIAVLNMEGY